MLQWIVDQQQSSSCISSVSNPHCACQGSCTVSFGRQTTKVCVLWASVKFKRHFPVLQGTHCVPESISRTRFSRTGFSDWRQRFTARTFLGWMIRSSLGTQTRFQLDFVSGSLKVPLHSGFTWADKIQLSTKLKNEVLLYWFQFFPVSWVKFSHNGFS